MEDDERPQQEFKFEPAVGPEGPVFSMNEIVSYNLMRARRRHGWTQQDVATLLERYTGRPWSNASVSAAERAWQGGRPRRFDANELVALTKIFDEPLTYFFLPPDEDKYSGKWVSMQQIEGKEVPRTTDSDPYALMALLPTAVLMESIATNDPSLDFLARMTKSIKRHLGVDYIPSSFTVHIGRDQEEEVDWGEVMRAKDAETQLAATEPEVTESDSSQPEEQRFTLPREAYSIVAAEEIAEALSRVLEKKGMRLVHRSEVSDEEWAIVRPSDEEEERS
ncbi:hypothetical protein [Streptomyces sp. NPDC001741]|uniref:hypothetical protein n=1 Tax=Streptomyces sp. NPDC001741 TaxID=3364605 RepID=UPI0036AB205E